MPTTPNSAGPSSGTQDLGRAASELGRTAAQAAGHVADTQIDRQKQNATGVLDQVADALKKTGEQLRSSQQDRIARFAEEAANRVQQFSGSVRGASPGDWIRRTEDLARREPGLFLGGAFFLGLLGARFLKSSDRRERPSSRSQPTAARERDDVRWGVGDGGTRTSIPEAETAVGEHDDFGGATDELSGVTREH